MAENVSEFFGGYPWQHLIGAEEDNTEAVRGLKIMLTGVAFNIRGGGGNAGRYGRSPFLLNHPTAMQAWKTNWRSNKMEPNFRSAELKWYWKYNKQIEGKYIKINYGVTLHEMERIECHGR